MSIVRKRPLSQSITGEAPQAVIVGTSGDDTLTGTSGDDEIQGLEGNDTLNGLGGNDFLNGGTGDDVLNGSSGDDTYFLDSAADQANDAASGGYDSAYTTVTYTLGSTAEIEILAALDQAGTGALNLYGNGFNNWIWGNNGANFLFGGGGNDILDAFGGGDAMNGGDGNDYISGGEGSDSLVGGRGNDTMVGGNGNDYLDGRISTFDIFTDNDTLIGGAGDDTYFVDHAGDVIIEAAGQGFDTVNATGSFTLNAGVEVELLVGLGNDSLALRGNEFNNTIWGNNTGGTLTGGGGNDVLMGLGGDDFMVGEDGNDYLDGGTGGGRLFGGAGADTFAFSNFIPGTDMRIEDFVSGTDKLLFYSNVFTGLAPGPLPASAFVQGTTSFGPGSLPDADDRFYYDITSGQLVYDPDGSGAAPAAWSVYLQPSTPGAALVASDFIVF